MKKIIIALVAVMATCTLSAQELRWGATGGLNFAWLKSSVLNSSDCYLGFNLGAKVEMDMADAIKDGFYVDARLLYTLKGGQWQNMHQNLGYLELPLNFCYRYAINNDITLFGGLGPYFGLGLLGKNVDKAGDTKVKTDLFGEVYKSFDFGLNYNLGVELWNEWQIFLGFEHSLLNALKTDIDEVNVKYKPMNFYIGTAYMF